MIYLRVVLLFVIVGTSAKTHAAYVVYEFEGTFERGLFEGPVVPLGSPFNGLFSFEESGEREDVSFNGGIDSFYSPVYVELSVGDDTIVSTTGRAKVRDAVTLFTDSLSVLAGEEIGDPFIGTLNGHDVRVMQISLSGSIDTFSTSDYPTFLGISAFQSGVVSVTSGPVGQSLQSASARGGIDPDLAEFTVSSSRICATPTCAIPEPDAVLLGILGFLALVGWYRAWACVAGVCWASSEIRASAHGRAAERWRTRRHGSFRGEALMRVMLPMLFVWFALSQPAAAITILSQSAHLWVEARFTYYGPDDCPPGVVPSWPDRLELTSTELRDFEDALKADDPYWGTVARSGLRSTIEENSITIRGGAVASGIDDFCVYADGDAFAEVTVTFRLTAPRYVEVEGSASKGGAISVRGPEHPIFADSPGSWTTDTFWAAHADDDAYSPGELYYLYEFSEDRPPWPAGDYTIHARVSQIQTGPEGESGGFTMSLVAVVPEPSSFALACVAILGVGIGAAGRRRGGREVFHLST